jgi:hypothetical protein
VVAVSAPKASGGVAVGEPGRVTAKVTAVGGPVSLISLGKGLVASSAAAAVTVAPAGLSGFSLAGGTSRSFVFVVKALKAGSVTLTAVATGTSSGGAKVQASGSVTVRIGASALSTVVVTSPATLRLKVADDGSVVPASVTVTVRVKNTSAQKIRGVQLLSLNPEPADPTQALDQLAFPKGSLPYSLPKPLLPGASSAPKTFRLRVTGDGEYDIRAIALYDDPSQPGGNGRAVSVGGDFKVTVPLLYFSTKVDDANVTRVAGEPYVKAGATWYVDGTIKNESSYQQLCVLPVVPALSGNAAGTGPVDITAPGDLRSVGAPFAGALAPGKKVSLTMYVDTSADGATLGKVGFAPVAGLLDPNGACTSGTAPGLTKIGPTDLTVPKGSSDLSVHVDVSQPLTPPAAKGVPTLNFFAGLGQNFVGDTFSQVLDLVALARSASSTPDEYKALSVALGPNFGGQAGRLAQATIKAAQALDTATAVYANYWRTASNADKQSLVTQTASVLSRVSGDFWTNVQQVVSQAALPWMNQMEAAEATGSDAQVWHLWGQVAGSTVQQFVTFMFAEAVAARVTETAPQLEAVAENAQKDWEAAEEAAEAATPADSVLPPETTLQTVPPGTVLTPLEEATLWGVDATTDQKLAAISEEYDVLIGVRGRQAASIEKLEAGSVWKNEAIKPKNVNEIDVQFLGFQQSDLSEVRFRTYTDQQIAAIRSNIENAGLTADQQAAVLDRFETRIGEQKYVSKIEGFSKKGQINVGFNYRDNGVNRASTSVLRKFDLEATPIGAEGDIPAGGTYYTPYQENPKYAKLAKSGGPLPPDCKAALLTVLCTITGDVDGVYVTTVAGGAVPPATLVKVYEALQEAGWQHPETLTWINNQGEFFFGAKAKILKGLEQGTGEAMIEFAPDGKRRATYVNLGESSLIGTSNYRVSIVGGYTAYLGG